MYIIDKDMVFRRKVEGEAAPEKPKKEELIEIRRRIL